MSLPINYLSACDEDYAKGLKAAKSLDDLVTHVEIYRRVADDAWQVVSKMSGEQFLEFRKGYVQETKGNFAGEEFAEKYGDVMMPATLFQVSMVANHFKTPWGCAFIRLKEVGKITEKKGIATYAELPQASDAGESK